MKNRWVQWKRSDLSNAHPNLIPQNLAHWNFSSAVLQILIPAAVSYTFAVVNNGNELFKLSVSRFICKRPAF